MRSYNHGRSNGRGAGQGQEPSPQNSGNSNGNGCGRGLLVVGFNPFGRNTQIGEQFPSHGRGRELNLGSPLSWRGRGQVSDSMPGPSFPM